MNKVVVPKPIKTIPLSGLNSDWISRVSDFAMQTSQAVNHTRISSFIFRNPGDSTRKYCNTILTCCTKITTVCQGNRANQGLLPQILPFTMTNCDGKLHSARKTIPSLHSPFLTKITMQMHANHVTYFREASMQCKIFPTGEIGCYAGRINLKIHHQMFH